MVIVRDLGRTRAGKDLAPQGSQLEDKFDFAVLSFGSAFDLVGMQARQITGKTTYEALFLYHDFLRARVGQRR